MNIQSPTPSDSQVTVSDKDPVPPNTGTKKTPAPNVKARFNLFARVTMHGFDRSAAKGWAGLLIGLGVGVGFVFIPAGIVIAAIGIGLWIYSTGKSIETIERANESVRKHVVASITCALLPPVAFYVSHTREGFPEDPND